MRRQTKYAVSALFVVVVVAIASIVEITDEGVFVQATLHDWETIDECVGFDIGQHPL